MTFCLQARAAQTGKIQGHVLDPPIRQRLHLLLHALQRRHRQVLDRSAAAAYKMAVGMDIRVKVVFSVAKGQFPDLA